MTVQDDLERIQHPVPRFYVASVAGSLLVVALVFVERGLGGAAFLLLALGGIGLYTRYRTVPPVVLLFVAVVLVARTQGHDLVSGFYKLVFPWTRVRTFFDDYRPDPLLDAFVALLLLVYLQGQYRLVGLLTQALPAEGYGGGERRKPVPRELPEGDTGEGLGGVAQLVVVLVVAIFSWVAVSVSRPPVDLAIELWRGLVLAWALGAALLLATTAVRMAFWYAAPKDVHEVFLQDVLWRETRKEQARIDRWVMHARLKAQRKKEKS